MEQLLTITQEISDVKTDVAVLETEVQNFKRVMERLDEAITAMSRVSSNLERLLIVHEERIKNNEAGLAAHIKNNEAGLAAHSRSVDENFASIKTRLRKLEEHKQLMEKWRWQAVGAWSVIVVMATTLAKVLHLW